MCWWVVYSAPITSSCCGDTWRYQNNIQTGLQIIHVSVSWYLNWQTANLSSSQLTVTACWCFGFAGHVIVSSTRLCLYPWLSTLALELSFCVSDCLFLQYHRACFCLVISFQHISANSFKCKWNIKLYTCTIICISSYIIRVIKYCKYVGIIILY